MLTDRIHISPPDPNSASAEDILSTSLGVIFPDDINNQHGDASTPVVYSSPKHGDIKLTLADPKGEDNRRLFSHHLWNASVLMAI
jgi:EEF1A N-terminal glycine/lysine methyltransferase